MRHFLMIVIVAVLIFTGCDGKVGPVGPAGQLGPAGPKGLKETRVTPVRRDHHERQGQHQSYPLVITGKRARTYHPL